jgi:hypothetical protein
MALPRSFLAPPSSQENDYVAQKVQERRENDADIADRAKAVPHESQFEGTQLRANTVSIGAASQEALDALSLILRSW